MTDPLVEVVARMYGDFADRATLAEVLAVVARCRNDLDNPQCHRAARNSRTISPAAAHRSPHLACYRERLGS
jgi:hypothetical protein